jgi:hypothetical protein
MDTRALSDQYILSVGCGPASLWTLFTRTDTVCLAFPKRHMLSPSHDSMLVLSPSSQYDGIMTAAQCSSRCRTVILRHLAESELVNACA